MSNQDEQLIETRIPIYPRSVKGNFRSVKWVILVLAYSVFFLLPWLRWERPTGVDQAILFDLQGRLFYIFDLVVHPQDIFWLAAFLMVAALLLFFVTGLAGRVFCGYFCFQTLWTDVFVFIEHLIQGERPARIRLGKQAWNAEKILKLTATHLSWLTVAFATGLTFVLYWGNAPDLVVDFFTGQAAEAAYATTFLLMTATYLFAGVVREQTCTYMCPYSRFQSAMFDKNTLIVTYDEQRGEGKAGRTKIAKGYKTREERTDKGTGDCIDCGYCVQVCPTGIDIRNGLQVQCIHCALCIDACNSIMDKMQWPRGLIRYSSENELKEGKKTNLLSLKTLGYGVFIVGITLAMVWSMMHQALWDATVMRVRQPMYVTLSDGRIQNSYEIKVNNKTQQAFELGLTLQGLDDAELNTGKVKKLVLEPLDDGRLLVKIRLDVRDMEAKQVPFDFVLSAKGRDDLQDLVIGTQFFRP